MKLILAIVNDSDVQALNDAMLRGSFSVTKVGSTGGLLKSGQTTLLSCVQNESVGAALEIVRTSTHGRKYRSCAPAVDSSVYLTQSLPAEIVVGGATVFVLNVEESYKF